MDMKEEQYTEMEMKEEQFTDPASSEPNNSVSEESAGKRGGPRTTAGKQRSKYNATKHGIFFSEFLLCDESPKEFGSLLKGLRKSLLPVGRLEDLLVEKLATIEWRHRRFLDAESAEIERVWGVIECERDAETRPDTRIASQVKSPDLLPYGGLLRAELNVEALEQSVCLLAELRDKTTKEGLDLSRILCILQEIYNLWGPMSHSLRFAQVLCSIYLRRAEQLEQAEKDQMRRWLLGGIDQEITNLREYRKTIEKYQTEAKKQAKLRHSVLDFPALDRLMRYEAHLSRLEDRTLGQLERLQRMRLGHPVPPRVKLEVSRN